MNRFLKVTFLLFASCLVIGAGVLFAGTALGGTWADASVQISGVGLLADYDQGHGLLVFKDESEDEDSDAAELSRELCVDADEVQELELFFRKCRVWCLAAKDDTISVEIAEAGESYFAVKQDGDTLTVKDTRKSSAFGLKTIEVKLYLPADKVFDRVAIDVGAGDIYIDTLAAREIRIDGGAGAVNAQKLIASEELDVELGAGEFYIAEAVVGEMDIECGVGTFELARCTLNGDADIEGGVGEVRIGIIGEKTDYNYELSCGMGELEVFGDSYASLGREKEIDNGARYTISLECGVGGVYIYQAE